MSELLRTLLSFGEAQTPAVPDCITIFKDVVVPLCNIVGWVVVFFNWEWRKKREHKLMRQTRAYEILLDKEMSCYEELIPMVDSLVYKLSDVYELYDEYRKGGKNRCSEKSRECGAEIKALDDIVHIKRIYMNEAIIVEYTAFYVAVMEYNNAIDSAAKKLDRANDKENSFDELFNKCTLASIRLRNQIRKHLANMSNIA